MIVFGFMIYTEASAQAPKWLGWLIPSGQDPAAPVQIQEALVPNPISEQSYPITSNPISTSYLEIQQVIEKNNTEAITLLAPGFLHISKERQIFPAIPLLLRTANSFQPSKKLMSGINWE